MKKTLAKGLALAFIGSLFVAGSAMAVPSLYFSDGSTNFTVVDGDANDTNILDGIVAYTSYTGQFGGWVLDAEGTGYTKPIYGSSGSPKLDLLSGTLTGGTGTFQMVFSEIDFGPLNPGIPGFKTAIGGTTDGQVTASSWYDNSNTIFGKNQQIGALGPFSSGAFSDEVLYGGIPSSSPFSMTLDACITHGTGTNLTTLDLHLSPVPEPATMLLFGTGLAGLATLRRRKANK